MTFCLLLSVLTVRGKYYLGSFLQLCLKMFGEVTNDKSLIITSVNCSHEYKHIRLKFVV